jgi:hypothetical protein
MIFGSSVYDCWWMLQGGLHIFVQPVMQNG